MPLRFVITVEFIVIERIVIEIWGKRAGLGGGRVTIEGGLVRNRNNTNSATQKQKESDRNNKNRREIVVKPRRIG
jgi:hypothetical protein